MVMHSVYICVCVCVCVCVCAGALAHVFVRDGERETYTASERKWWTEYFCVRVQFVRKVFEYYA